MSIINLVINKSQKELFQLPMTDVLTDLMQTVIHCARCVFPLILQAAVLSTLIKYNVVHRKQFFVLEKQ